jgi:hypothetical protein
MQQLPFSSCMKSGSIIVMFCACACMDACMCVFLIICFDFVLSGYMGNYLGQ